MPTSRWAKPLKQPENIPKKPQINNKALVSFNDDYGEEEVVIPSKRLHNENAKPMVSADQIRQLKEKMQQQELAKK